MGSKWRIAQADAGGEAQDSPFTGNKGGVWAKKESLQESREADGLSDMAQTGREEFTSARMSSQVRLCTWVN